LKFQTAERKVFFKGRKKEEAKRVKRVEYEAGEGQKVYNACYTWI
jgi:hypothetical protein